MPSACWVMVTEGVRPASAGRTLAHSDRQRCQRPGGSEESWWVWRRNVASGDGAIGGAGSAKQGCRSLTGAAVPGGLRTTWMRIWHGSPPPESRSYSW